ncbi:hypothetical protein INT45_006922 [Circinella minor]|uniref:NuBaID C-terminal domain-containing protein n=1 Tax=Circinella minor TaxID=1195481 RepID=A0A8H7S470_9FUNG|nr:hypothetical protein INT45_006922 [Circinella minor]
MEASTEDTVNNTNNVLQTYDEVQKLCETIKNKRNYPKRSIHHVITTTNSFIPSKRVRSAETVMDNTENTPPKNNMNNELASEEFSPTNHTTHIPLKLSLDREAFYKRLETYSTLFISKRRPVNALQCAMHGFIDTHIAGGAKGNIFQEIKQTYLEELSKSHRPGCFWKFDKCSDDIYAFPYGTSSEALDLIKTEGSRLLECDSLPTINHPLTTEQCEKLDVIIETFENTNNNTFLSSESKRIPYIIAMFGWRLDNNKNSLKCHHCFRTIQNSSFTSSSFNLINNHMEYCSWINRKQAMIQPMNEEGIRGNTEDNSICGYEWMIHMMDLEYDFLFYIRESSAEYQESRLQWFRNTRRRMAESRTALAMEFPDSPESIPELTKNIGDEGEQILLEKEKEKPVINEETVIFDEQLQEQEHVDEEPSIPENGVKTQVEPTETLELESTKEQQEEEEEEEPSSKPSQEVEDELMDFMESEPEDEGEAEPTTTNATTAATTTATVEEEKVEETTTDIDIDVSLLEDVQTPTTGVSTPVPDQLQQDHLDDEVHDDSAIIVTPSSDTKELSSPPTSTVESAEDEAATITNTTIDMEMTDKAQEALTTSGDKDEQQQQADNTTATVLTPSIQVEEIGDDGNELINDENINQVTEESSTVPIISMEEDVELVSSSSPTTVDGQEKEHVSTTEEKKEEEDLSSKHETQDSVLINEEENKDDIQHQEQDGVDQFKTEEQVQDETTDQSKAKEQEKEEEETSIDLAVQQQQEEEDNKNMEVLEQTVPQVGHDVSEDAIVVTSMEEDEKEEEEMEEIQDTVSVSTKLEQENDTTGNDKDNERQTPTSDSLEGLDEEDGLDHSQHTISNDNVLRTKQSDDLIQETEQEGEVTEPQEEQVVSNDKSKPTTTSVIDKESTTKEKEEEEETVEVEETVDGVIVSETTIISSTEKTSNNKDNDENEDEKEADNTPTTVEIVELDNENNEKDNSETPFISLDNTRDGMTTIVSDSVDEVKEQSDITESTDESTAAATGTVAGVEATNASENVVVENTQSEEELKPLMDNFGTPVLNQSGSTPQILQSMEDALGQSPGHPDTSTTATITDNDTQQAVELTETSAQESSVAAAAAKEEEEQTTTVVINDDYNAPKKDLEDPMIEDRQEVIVSNSLVGTTTNNDSNTSNENTTGAQGHDYVEQGEEKEVNSGGENGNETIGEAMDEDNNNNDNGGDVNMREIVDEEMENVEEEQGEAMEEVPAPPSTTITTTVAAATEESRQL